MEINYDFNNKYLQYIQWHNWYIKNPDYFSHYKQRSDLQLFFQEAIHRNPTWKTQLFKGVVNLNKISIYDSQRELLGVYNSSETNSAVENAINNFESYKKYKLNPFLKFWLYSFKK